jgi:hypothetical protein
MFVDAPFTQGAFRLRRLRARPSEGRAHAGQRARRHRLALAAAKERSHGQAPHRPGLHRSRQCTGHAATCATTPQEALRHGDRRSANSMRDQSYASRRSISPRSAARSRSSTREKYLSGAATSPPACPIDVKDRIRQHGLRNSHLLSIAPTGTISLAFADNASNGIEPPFSWTYTAQEAHGRRHLARIYDVEDYAWRKYRHLGGDIEQAARRTSSPRWKSPPRPTRTWSRPSPRTSTPPSPRR